MKKLLSILASTGLMATTAASVVACGPKTPDEKPPIDNGEKKEAVLKKIKEINDNPKSFIFKEQPKQKDVQDKLEEYLKEFKDVVTFENINFKDISHNKDEVQNGTLTLNILVNEEKLVNPETKDDNFIFSFNTEENNKINEVLNQLKQGANVNLGDFKVDLGLGEGPIDIKALIDLIGAFGISDLIPTKIPTKFDITDPNWKEWNNSLETIKALLNQIEDGIFDKELTFKMDMPLMEGTDGHVGISTKISDILNSILPDLIHFRNFILEQQGEGKENVLLLLIQYLFDKPRDINNDGYAKINQEIKVEGKEDEYIKFETNLEHLLHNILEGWQNENGEMWENATKTGPLEIKIWAGDSETWDDAFLKTQIKYQTFKGKGLLLPERMGVLDLLPINNIKDFINQLLHYNFLDEDQSLPLILKIEAPVIGSKEIEITQLGSLIKDQLGNILNTDKNLEGKLSNWNFDLKQGTLNIEILNSENKWISAEKFEDILDARDIRVKLTSNNLEIKVGEAIFKLENINIILNLDIKSSSIIS